MKTHIFRTTPDYLHGVTTSGWCNQRNGEPGLYLSTWREHKNVNDFCRGCWKLALKDVMWRIRSDKNSIISWPEEADLFFDSHAEYQRIKLFLLHRSPFTKEKVLS